MKSTVWCLLMLCASPSINGLIFDSENKLQIYLNQASSAYNFSLVTNKEVTPRNLHLHSCRLINPGAAYKAAILSNNGVLIHTPCLDKDSFGNKWSNYVESRLCAQVTGMHFITPSKICCDQGSNVEFFNPISSVVYNSKWQKNGIQNIPSLCHCQAGCHGNPKALIHTNTNDIKSLFFDLVDIYRLKLAKLNKNLDISSAWNTTLRDAHTSLDGTGLPLIPDVAIHYRCGDNMANKKYGLLKFHYIVETIKREQQSFLLSRPLSTIYVLADSEHRKTTFRQRETCATVFKKLQHLLKTEFPTSTIVVLRGANLYEDLVRLSFAKLTICSVSTFCLWPAISNPNKAYFPVSAVIAANTMPYYGDNFVWIRKQSPHESLFGTNVKELMSNVK